MFGRELNGSLNVVGVLRDENPMRHHLIHARVCRVQQAGHFVGPDFTLYALAQRGEEIAYVTGNVQSSGNEKWTWMANPDLPGHVWTLPTGNHLDPSWLGSPDPSDRTVGPPSYLTIRRSYDPQSFRGGEKSD